MSKQQARPRSNRVQFMPNRIVHDMLVRLLATGLYGKNIVDVVRRLIEEGLEERFIKWPGPRA